MLHLIAPFGLAGFLARLIDIFPYVLSPFAFGLVVFLYLRVLGPPLTAVLGRLDFFVATSLRRLGASPPGIQHAIADVIPRLPKWLSRIGVTVLLLGMATQVMAIVSEEPDGLPALLFEMLEFVDGTGSVIPFDQQDFAMWLDTLGRDN